MSATLFWLIFLVCQKLAVLFKIVSRLSYPLMVTATTSVCSLYFALKVQAEVVELQGRSWGMLPGKFWNPKCNWVHFTWLYQLTNLNNKSTNCNAFWTEVWSLKFWSKTAGKVELWVTVCFYFWWNMNWSEPTNSPKIVTLKTEKRTEVVS